MPLSTAHSAAERHKLDPVFIDRFYELFVQAVTVGMVALSEAVMVMMIGIFAIRFFYVVTGFMEGRENMIGIAVSHLVPVILLAWLSVEWITITKTAAAAAMELGQIASGNQGNTIALFKISEIIVNGFRLVKGIWEYMASLGNGVVAAAKNFWFLGYYLGASIIIIISQFYVAYIIFRSNIEFALHSLGTLAMLPFAGAGQTAWVIQNGLGGYVAHLINLMLLSVAVNIGQPLMDSAMVATEPSYQQAGIMAGVAVMYSGLCFLIRNMAQGFINGGPALSGHGGVGGAVMGLIKGGLAGAAFQLTRNHMQNQQAQQNRQAALTHQPQGGITGASPSEAVGSRLLMGRQWADTPSPYAAAVKEAKAGYHQAFESNVASTPNLPNGFADQVRADFNKVNAEAGKRSADLLKRGYWEQFGFGHAEPSKQPVSRQINTSKP
jgi:type IV secretory pathway TrbL component